MKNIASALPETDEACVGNRITGMCVICLIVSTAKSTFSRLKSVEPPTINPSVPASAVCLASVIKSSELVLPGSRRVK